MRSWKLVWNRSVIEVSLGNASLDHQVQEVVVTETGRPTKTFVLFTHRYRPDSAALRCAFCGPVAPGLGRAHVRGVLNASTECKARRCS